MGSMTESARSLPARLASAARLGAAAGVITAVLAAAPGGCARDGTVAGAPAAWGEAPARTPLARRLDGASPVVVGGDNGLELRWWVSAADGASLGGVLAPYADRPIPIDAHHRALLESNGLRAVAVPLDRLANVQSRLATIGAEQRQWLGQAPAWIEAVPGPERPEGQTIRMHDGPLRLGPGRLRLLVRCWTIPLAPTTPGGPAAALHVELIPQHRESSPVERSADGLALTPAAAEAEDQGLLFTRLLTRMTAPRGEAILLVPERPGTKWRPVDAVPDSSGADADPAPSPGGPAPPRPAPAVGQVVRGAPGAEPGAAGGVGARAPADGTARQRSAPAAEAGPPSEASPTLGEAMLMSALGDPSPRTVRAVVVLIPRVPDRYVLLPR